MAELAIALFPPPPLQGREGRFRNSGKVIDIGIRKQLGVGAFLSVQMGDYIADWVLAMNNDRSCSMDGAGVSQRGGGYEATSCCGFKGRGEACVQVF